MGSMFSNIAQDSYCVQPFEIFENSFEISQWGKTKSSFRHQVSKPGQFLGSSTLPRGQCDVCSSKLTTARSLKRNSRIPSGDKPYKCEVCSSTFTEMEVKKTHSRIHSGEEPYKCELCSATFSHFVHLKTHSRIYSGRYVHLD